MALLGLGVGVCLQVSISRGLYMKYTLCYQEFISLLMTVEALGDKCAWSAAFAPNRLLSINSVLLVKKNRLKAILQKYCDILVCSERVSKKVINHLKWTSILRKYCHFPKLLI